jgi:hypothetical protein
MKGYARLKNACKYSDVSQTTMRNWFMNGLKFSKVKGILLIKLLSSNFGFSKRVMWVSVLVSDCHPESRI